MAQEKYMTSERESGIMAGNNCVAFGGFRFVMHDDVIGRKMATNFLQG